MSWRRNECLRCVSEISNHLRAFELVDLPATSFRQNFFSLPAGFQNDFLMNLPGLPPGVRCYCEFFDLSVCQPFLTDEFL